MMAIFQIIAKAVNTSIISDSCAATTNQKMNDHFHIFPQVTSIPGNPYVLTQLLHEHPRIFKNFHLTYLPFSGYNFAYCQTTNAARVLPTGSNPPGLVYLIALVLVLLLSTASLCISITAKPFSFDVNRFGFTLISFLVMLIDKGLRNSFQYKRSVLQIVVIIMCIFTGNYYLANVTSFLVRPVKINVMTTISELVDHNYFLIFAHLTIKTSLNASVSYVRETRQNMGLNSPKELDMLSVLLQKQTKVFAYGTSFKFGKALAFHENAAVVDLWNIVISVVNYANVALSISKKKTSKSCYIGKHIINIGETYQMYSTLNGIQLGRIAKMLLSTGIYEHWYKEFNGMQIANRVQDRAKVKSRTKIIYDFEEPNVAPIKVAGRIKALLLMWLGVCGGIVGLFCCEISFQLLSLREVLNYCLYAGRHSIYYFGLCVLRPRLFYHNLYWLKR